MEDQVRYIGIDIAKSSFDIFIPNADKSLNCSLKNTPEGWEELSSLLRQSDICVMEATGAYHIGLATYLYNSQREVCVVNPLRVKHFSRMKMVRAKTDKADSALLSHYGDLIKPQSWRPKDDEFIDLQQLTSLSEQLIKQRTALKNQLQSFKLVPKFNSTAVTILAEQIDNLTAKLKVIEVQIQQIITENYGELNKCLTSIPGIGPKAATALLVLTEGFTKFDNYKALIAYAGLAPRTFESGTSVKGASHICKLGAKSLRKILYVCSHSAKRFNPTCKKLFDRLHHEKKKPFKVAMIAVANKLIKLAFTLAINLTEFDPEYQLNFKPAK